MSSLLENTFVRGNTLRTTLEVRNDAGVLVDPATLGIAVKDSTGFTSSYVYPGPPITRVVEGIYRADIVLTLIGVWEYEWDTTDPIMTSGAEVYVVADPTSSAPSLPSIADYARMYLGGQNWYALTRSEDFGPGYVTLAIETIKRRVLLAPPVTPLEYLLNPLVLDYLGILVALQLIPACRDYWASQAISHSIGNDPTEVETFTDRARMVGQMQDDLMRRLAAIQVIAMPHIDSPVVVAQSQMGSDEEFDRVKVTEDPRDFPSMRSFPNPDYPLIRFGRPS